MGLSGKRRLRLADSEQLPAHFLLGSDAVQFAGQAETMRAQEADRWPEITTSTDAKGPIAKYQILRVRPKTGF
jgi:hypothetical protein